MYGLPKRERLHLKKHIDELFAQGKGFVAYPLRVMYQTIPPSESREGTETAPTARAMMMVSVGKRYFRRANKRNRVKRLIREAYRLNKHLWIEHLEREGLYGRIALMFVGKELPEYKDIERAVLKAFTRLTDPNREQTKPSEALPTKTDI